MSNPLLVFWQLFSRHNRADRVPFRLHLESSTQASSTIFLVMRRMRAPLITLIVIFSVSVIGLTLIPGVDPEGQPDRLSIFESFYFWSYTATTIGFGELPYPFSPAQRLWVTFAIYLSVIGWAYAIGSLLTLVQDRSFRQALALGQFTRQVARRREPFLLLVGYGRAGELLAKDFDALGQQLVVVDESPERVEALDLGSYHADIPGLVADASNPHHLSAAGLDHPYCAGVLALTNDDQTNLAVTMTAALVRPDLPVISRTVSAAIAERMRAFGTPTVINPFDRFGDHLRLALNAPASYQLLTWLEAGPGAELPERGDPPTHGRWVMCGYGRFGQEVTSDLRAAGLEVTIIEPTEQGEHEPGVIVGDASDPAVLARADLPSAVGLVAGTDNDTTNLSMLATARRLNPDLFLAARQNRPTSAALFEAMHTDALLVPTEVVAHEVYALISTPMLWRFIQEIPARGNAWAADLVQRLRHSCGRELPALWKLKLDSELAPALVDWLAGGRVALGELLRSPEDRQRRLDVVPLLLLRDGQAILTPDLETVLAPGDELLFAGQGSERRELESTLEIDSTAAYVLFDEHIPSSWIWRKLSRKPSLPTVEAREDLPTRHR
ncbi:MAG TPA: NAD-binding protein [Propionibacteriaceae bacterium]|nr:NAD-binding protein [Propionibacteriaceae bacterium]